MNQNNDQLARRTSYNEWRMYQYLNNSPELTPNDRMEINIQHGLKSISNEIPLYDRLEVNVGTLKKGIRRISRNRSSSGTSTTATSTLSVISNAGKWLYDTTNTIVSSIVAKINRRFVLFLIVFAFVVVVKRRKKKKMIESTKLTDACTTIKSLRRKGGSPAKKLRWTRLKDGSYKFEMVPVNV